jgi:hypothetical protein
VLFFIAVVLVAVVLLTLTHMAGEMFQTIAGVDLFHVPYRGAQVFPALLTGEAQVYFGYSHRSNMSGPAISAPWR